MASASPAPNKPARKRARANGRPRNELPLVAAVRLDESLSLLQAEDDELDLSGDIGAVGRVKVDGEDLMLDIKGTLYRAIPYPTNSMCVVAVDGEDAKITAVMNHAIVLHAERNLFSADDGALDGHVYDDEAEDPQVSNSPLREDVSDKSKNGKTGKSASRKRGRPAKAAKASNNSTKAPKKSISKSKSTGQGLKTGKGKRK